MKCHVSMNPWGGGYAVYLYIDLEGTRTRLIRQPDGSDMEVQRGMVHNDIKPTFTLDEDDARNLIEALQREGVQPRQLTLVEGQYDAQGKHLADLQNILKTKGLMK